MSEPKTYLPEPASVAMRSGCKVSWLYFATEQEAQAAAIIALHNAEVAEAEGYDFGYQAPGAIRFVKDQTGEAARYNGLWEVCFP
jgi:hypothetical protein